MSNTLWVEWMGVWGSGKTTSINHISTRLECSGYTVNSTTTFFVRNRFVKFYKAFSGFSHTIIASSRLLGLLLPTYFSAYFKKNTIVTSELRSFLSCYLARLSLVNSHDIDITLWEGEFHLLPLLGLNQHSLEKAIDILLYVNRHRTNRFILMNMDTKLAMSHIIKEHRSGTNIRFTEEQRKQLSSSLEHFSTAQAYLVQQLKKRGSLVYESDGNIEDIRDFIELA